MKKRILALLCVLSLMVVTLAGCGSTSEETASTDQTTTTQATEEASTGTKEAIFGIDSESFSNNWSPHTDWNGWKDIRYGITETLFKLNNETLELEPWIAESFENIDDYTWTITLKDNVTFSNGKALTSEMVIANLEDVAGQNYRAAGLIDAEYTVDGNMITIKTVAPYATFINDLADPMMSIIDMESGTDVVTNPIGTGPYIMTELIPDTQATFEKNTNYWNGEAKMDGFIIKTSTDADTLAMALQSGEVDLCYNMTPANAELFRGNDDYIIDQKPTTRVYMLFINNETVPDVNVRKAINMAIDKESIATYLLKGTMTPSVGPFPNSLAYGNGLKDGGFDLEGAKALLETAGYTDTDGDGFVDKDGEPLTISLCLYSRLSQEVISTELQAEMKLAGINVEITLSDNRDYLKAGAFDLGMYCVATAPVGDPEGFLKTYVSSTSGLSYGKYNNPEVDALIEELSTVFDTDERYALALEIQQKVIDDAGYIFLGTNNISIVSTNAVSGFENPMSEYYNVTIETDINK